MSRGLGDVYKRQVRKVVIGVDVGIWVGLPLNFIVIIAGPSFFGD